MGTEGKFGLATPAPIPDGEPVFLLRAQDSTLPELLQEYGRLCHAAGSPPHHLADIATLQRAVVTWQAEHGATVPGSRGGR